MLHAYAIRRGRIVPEMPEPAPGQAWVYEVLRLMRGVPLFCEDHLERLAQSARLAGLTTPMPDAGEWKQHIRALAEANDVYEGNVKILLSETDQALCFIPHRYPTPHDYERGVALALLEAERPNPHAKVVNAPLRERADARMREKQVYEVLLLDHEGCITEGSRSNCFFIRSGTVLTPPAQQVLPGITRSAVLHICRELALPLQERPIARSDLAAMEAAFITGTSPGVLPVCQIEDIPLHPTHSISAIIRSAYEEKVQTYLSSNGF